MAKYFTYVDRILPIKFFEEDPITVTVLISDAMAQKIDAGMKKLQQSSAAEQFREILVSWIGEENTAKLLARADDVDSYTIAQLLWFIYDAYIEGQAKNLKTARAGRLQK